MDLNNHCPLIPETEEYEMYLDALVDDISKLPQIKSVVRKDSIFYIATKYTLDVQELKKQIQPYLTNDRCCQYRMESLLVV